MLTLVRVSVHEVAPNNLYATQFRLAEFLARVIDYGTTQVIDIGTMDNNVFLFVYVPKIFFSVLYLFCSCYVLVVSVRSSLGVSNLVPCASFL